MMPGAARQIKQDHHLSLNWEKTFNNPLTVVLLVNCVCLFCFVFVFSLMMLMIEVETEEKSY